MVAKSVYTILAGYTCSIYSQLLGHTYTISQWRSQGGCFGCSSTPLASALHIIITVHALNHTTIMPFSRAFLARCTASSNAAPSQKPERPVNS